MSDFNEAFFRGAATQKLRQNHRDMSQMSTAIADAVVEQVKQRRTIDELEQDVVDLEFAIDRRDAHLEATQARSEYLLALLDEAYGAESNPARQIAHPDQDLRIPTGDRKDEVVTKADEVYLTCFKKAFEQRFANKWPHLNSWIKFLHEKISY